MRDFPQVPRQLLDALAKAFPDKAIRDPNATAGEVGAVAGNQQVIDFLRRKYEAQNPIKDER